MIEKTSIIFQLNNELTVHSISQIVNPSGLLESFSIQHIETIEKTGRVFNLANFLQQKWELWWQNTSLVNAGEMIFVSGGEAGFTDARMLYVWLKTWQEFSPKNRELKVVQTAVSNFENINIDDLRVLLTTWRKNSTANLGYARAPRIG